MTSSICDSNYEILYEIQKTSIEVVNMKTTWFPRFSSDYVQFQSGTKGKTIQVYNLIYDGISALNSCVQFAGATTAQVVNTLFGSFARAFKQFGYNLIGCRLERIFNAIYPVNPLNNQRHFVIPRRLEKFLGDYIIYPFNMLGKEETSELLQSPNQIITISQCVRNVLETLYKENKELLNPSTETPQFNYRVKTLISMDMQAFAVPAGGMVVCSQLIKELQGELVSEGIKNARIDFVDGSHVHVDLSDVKLDDVIAALLGHEMTHVASRHSIVSICSDMIQSLLLHVTRSFLLSYITRCDTTYQELKQKPDLSTNERSKLKRRESLYGVLNNVFKWVQDKINDLDGMLRTRKGEYEADTTGAYLASQAKFNPLGAIYLQEFLLKKNHFAFLHKHLEPFFSHPCGENRKRALFASIAKMSPRHLQGKLKWQFASIDIYDLDSLGPAYKYCKEIDKKISFS